jgi:hypothetical protein
MILDFALAYARRGLPVFPVRGKLPLTEHGHKEATTDAAKIRGWWSHSPHANVAVPTGAPSRLMVVDVDPRHGGDESLAALQATHGSLPETLEARTGGGGRHLFFALSDGQSVRNSSGKLGPGLDVRGDGGYVVVPPSIHPDTKQSYQWANRVKPASVPSWLMQALSAPTPESDSTHDASISEGQRNDALTRIAGAMRRKGCTQETIEAALLTENGRRCNPPLPEREVLTIVRSVSRYSPEPDKKPAPELKPRPETQRREVSSWVAENMAEFLAEDGVEVEALYENLLYRETITEIFAPRGLGKSIFALHAAIKLARKGIRVLYIDRDNPRRIIRERLHALGADDDLATLKVISREKCPPLTHAELWAQFPYADYDVVILDSFDAMAEGIGEQDSSKPSRAIAPILDIAHRENGPAVLVLGNCVKSAAHSRGSGIVEDRADIVFEVRDATDFQPSGLKPWVEELPAQGAGNWAARSSRRKLREQFRLAFICTKFRLGEEPSPFVIEIDTSTAPWNLRDVTDKVDQQSTETRERRQKEKVEVIGKAIEALRTELVRREREGEAQLLKMKAEIFLAGCDFKREVARKAIASPTFEIAEAAGQGHPKVVRLADKNQNRGGNGEAQEPSIVLGKDISDFRQPHEQAAAEVDAQDDECLCGSEGDRVSAEPSSFPRADTSEIGNQGDIEEGEI